MKMHKPKFFQEEHSLLTDMADSWFDPKIKFILTSDSRNEQPLQFRVYEEKSSLKALFLYTDQTEKCT